MTPYRDINDEEWQRVAPLLPELRPRSELRGRPLANTRSVLNGVLWVMYISLRCFIASQTGASRAVTYTQTPDAYCWRIQVCERPSSETPIYPRTTSFCPPSSRCILHL
jgi:transposase